MKSRMGRATSSQPATGRSFGISIPSMGGSQHDQDQNPTARVEGGGTGRMSTALHKRILAADYGDQDSSELMIKVWAGTPFVVNVRTGSINSETEREITEWCRENFGQDAWPIHGKPGKWQRGSATVHGETFIGFDSAESLALFVERFGRCVIEDATISPETSEAGK
jgi:hypothetical protein